MLLGAVLRRCFIAGFVLLACAHLLLTQESSFAMKSVTAAAITVAIGFGGYAKKSLDLTGISFCYKLFDSIGFLVIHWFHTTERPAFAEMVFGF